MFLWYYRKNKERLRKGPKEGYQNLSEGEENKKQKYGCKRYKKFFEGEKGKRHQYVRACYENNSEDGKQRIFEYKKVVVECH